MSPSRSLASALHNMLQGRDLPFHEFVELALYDPELGYYSGPTPRFGKTGDFVTSPLISPVFSFALARLVTEFMTRCGDGMCSIVDIGCGDGALIDSLQSQIPPELRGRARFAGVERSLDRVRQRSDALFTTDLSSMPRGDAQLLISNELFDAQPFARLVMRGGDLHELWVTERDGQIDWSEQKAEPGYVEYFSSRGIELRDGQFADVSLGWESLYSELCRFVTRGLIVTFDYGYAERQLFSGRVRQFGTAAAYSGHRVSRDLLANPGEQDLTAHINFTDLQRAGERDGFSTLLFDRQAKVLLALGAAEHELFVPLDDRRFDSAEEALALRERREEARRLVLPDGIGEEIRVLVQGKGVAGEGWGFQRALF